MNNFRDTDPYKVKQVSRYLDKILKDNVKSRDIRYWQEFNKLTVKIAFYQDREYDELSDLIKIQNYLSRKYETKKVYCTYYSSTKDFKIDVEDLIK